jgi:hypothetical protein
LQRDAEALEREGKRDRKREREMDSCVVWSGYEGVVTMQDMSGLRSISCM